MSDDALVLDEQQERDAQKCAATTSGASADFSTPGAGKTVVALRTAQLRGAQQVLVIAPLGTRLSWFDTARRIGIDLPFHWVQNTKAGQQAMVRLQFGEAGVYFIGPEYATRLAWDTLTDKNGDVIRNNKGKPIKKRNKFWNSITPDVLIIDECFVAGTMISTPKGDVAIESLKPGDPIYGYDHESNMVIETTVVANMQRESDMVMHNGSTPNHPYYSVGRGYYPFADMTDEDYFYEIQFDETLPSVRRVDYSQIPKRVEATKILREELRGESVLAGETRLPTGMDREYAATQFTRSENQGTGYKTHDRKQPISRPEYSCENAADKDGSRCNIRTPEWWKWNWSDECGENYQRSIGMANISSGKNWDEKGFWVPVSLQDRCCESGLENRDRMRWTKSYGGDPQDTRSEENRISGVNGLDHLAILEPRDRERYGRVSSESRCSDSVKVYNIETQSGNYFANGILVHNCHEGATNPRSDRHKVYASMSAGHIHALSGTPHGNTFDGIYPVTKILWPDHVPSNTAEFKRKYCKTEFDPFAWDKMKVVGELNEGAYFASLPCVVRREWKYDGSIDEETVYVELSAAQRKAYDELEKHMATVIEGDPFVVEFPSTLHIRLRQATLGMFCIEDDGSVGFAENCKSTKLDALMGRILPKDFHDEPALLFTDSKRFAYVTVARINREYGDGSAELYSGDQVNAERMAIRERFGSGETKYIVVVIKAGGTGLDGFQHATRNMCFISRDYARIKNEQANARVVRRGQGDLVRIRHIIAVNTADSGILSRHISDAIAMNRSMRFEK